MKRCITIVVNRVKVRSFSFFHQKAHHIYAYVVECGPMQRSQTLVVSRMNTRSVLQ